MANNKQIRREIVLTANGKAAEDMMKALAGYSNKLAKELKKLAAEGKSDTKEFKELQAVQKTLNKQMKENISDTQRIDKVMKDLAGSSTKQLRSALNALRREMDRMSEADGKLPQMREQFRKIQAQIDKNTGSIHKQGNAWSTALKNLTAYFGLMQVFSKVQSMITGVISANFKLSDQLADIRKVSGLLSQDIDKMAVSLSKIDTRTTVEELNRIAYAGAKLGIGEYGVEALEGFVKASNQVNVALKEDLGDEALTALSKITQVMGLIPKMGVEQSMLKTGSAIFKLASTSTATSGKIIDFSNRMLSLGKNAALSTADILALGAAVDSMALEPEVASTAFGKLVTEIRKGTGSMEKDLGLAKGSLKAMVEDGRGMDAILTIFKAMHEQGNVFALNGLFKDMGSDGARLVKTMVTMADKVDMLQTAVGTANEAFVEGVAITNEYNIQQQTAQGILERANNIWHKAFVNPEGVNSVKELALAWYDFSRAMVQSGTAQASLITSFKLLLELCKALITVLPAITGFFIGKSLVMAATGIWNIVTAVRAWALAQTALNAAMKSNVIGIVLGALSFAYSWFRKNAVAAEDAAKATDKFTKSLKEAKGEVGKAVLELDEYKKAIDKTNKGTKEREAAISNFNKKFGSYLSNLITEKSTAEDLARAYNEAATAIERKVMAQNKEKDVEQHVAPKAGREAQLLYDYDQAAKSAGIGFVGTNLKGFVDDNLTTKGTTATINELIRRSGVGQGYNEQYRKALFDALRNTHGKPADDFEWTYVDNDYNGTGRTRKEQRYGTLTEKEKLVGQAIAYIRQRAARVHAQQEVNEKYKYYPDIPLTEEVAGVPVGDGTNNATAPEDDARANISEFITKIKNFYERQITATMEELTAQGVEKELQDQAVADLQKRMDAALAAAQQSIVLGTKAWNEFKNSMDDDLKERADEYGQSQSLVLKDAVQAEDVAQLRADLLKQMPKIKKGQVVGMKSDERDRAYLDRMWLDASKNERKSATIDQKRMEQRRKELLEHSYTGVVQQNSFLGLVNAGFAGVSLGNLEADKQKVFAVLEKGRKELVKLFETDGEKDKLLTFLFGKDYAKNTPDVFAKLLTMSEEDVRLFYHKLVQYSDEYIAAQKKQYEDAKKVANQMWAVNKRNLASQKQLRETQNGADLFGKRTNGWSNLGLGDLTADPEVELMKLKMQMAEDYYAFVKKNSQNQQLIDEADKARQEAQLAYVKQMATSMKARLDQMHSFVAPIETFGSEMGTALAKMTDDTEDAGEAMMGALRNMIKSFGEMLINDLNTQMWKAIKDAGSKRAAKKAETGIMEAEANANADDVSFDTDMLGKTAQTPMYVWLVNGQTVDANGNPVQPTDANGQAMQTLSGQPGDTSSVGNTLGGVGADIGSAVSDVATGNGGIGEAAAGVGMGAIGKLMNVSLGGKHKNELKEAKKHEKDMLKVKEKGMKDQAKATDKGMDDMVDITDGGNDEQLKGTEIAQKGITTAVDTALNTTLKAKETNNQEQLQSDAARTKGEVTFSIAGAMAKCFEFLGPIAGPIAAAVVMSTLMGLLQWALSSALGGSKGNDNKAQKNNTKLVTGMLTYDNGNVQDLEPFVGDDGEVYWAANDDKKHSGVSLLSRPTATTINGQPSLVAEQGPEIVIGRETTHAMMMNNPSLLKALVDYDRNYSGRRALDAGNVGETVGDVPQGATDGLIANSTASNVALIGAINALLTRLDQPIEAYIDMYGRNKLYDSMQKANQFMRNKV